MWFGERADILILTCGHFSALVSTILHHSWAHWVWYSLLNKLLRLYLFSLCLHLAKGYSLSHHSYVATLFIELWHEKVGGEEAYAHANVMMYAWMFVYKCDVYHWFVPVSLYGCLFGSRNWQFHVMTLYLKNNLCLLGMVYQLTAVKYLLPKEWAMMCKLLERSEPSDYGLIVSVLTPMLTMYLRM